MMPILTQGSASTRLQRPAEPFTILLVEDDPMQRALFSTCLTEHGFAVLEASHGAGALRVCRSHRGPIHLLLTDVMLPKWRGLALPKQDMATADMNGIELAHQVMGIVKQIRVILMSGHPKETIKKQGDVKPGTPFLHKPFDTEYLVQRVHEVLRQRP
jgi:CheY-like chemotaxis protein